MPIITSSLEPSIQSKLNVINYGSNSSTELVTGAFALDSLSSNGVSRSYATLSVFPTATANNLGLMALDTANGVMYINSTGSSWTQTPTPVILSTNFDNSTTSYSSSFQMNRAFNIANAAFALADAQIGSNLFTWGIQAALGQGSTAAISSPQQVGSLSAWKMVQAGGGAFASGPTMFAIKRDGTLWQCGYSNQGQVGDGTLTRWSSPVQIGTSTWKTGFNTNEMTMGIRSDGTLWTWGNGHNNILGLGSTTNVSTPVQVGTATNWKYVHCGYNVAWGIKTDGTLWGWGPNAQGQLGLGNTTAVSTPVQVGTLTNWVSVCGGVGCTWATKSDGTLWTWGYNGQSQLGLGNNTSYSSPVQIGTATNWAYVSGKSGGSSTGSAAVAALTYDGSIYTWGLNNFTGLGYTTSGSWQTVPAGPVGLPSSWRQVDMLQDGIYQVTMAIRKDGTLWVIGGAGNNGALGLGSTTQISSPTQVGNLTNWKQISAHTYCSMGVLYPVSGNANVASLPGITNTTQFPVTFVQ
jgi:hypothetical protein